MRIKKYSKTPPFSFLFDTWDLTYMPSSIKPANTFHQMGSLINTFPNYMFWFVFFRSKEISHAMQAKQKNKVIPCKPHDWQLSFRLLKSWLYFWGFQATGKFPCSWEPQKDHFHPKQYKIITIPSEYIKWAIIIEHIQLKKAFPNLQSRSCSQQPSHAQPMRCWKL